MGVQIGDEVQVDIRGKLLKAQVTQPVFARNVELFINSTHSGENHVERPINLKYAASTSGF